MVVISIIMLIKSRHDGSGMDLRQMLFADTRAFSHSPNQSDRLHFLCITFDLRQLSPLEFCSVILTILF